MGGECCKSKIALLAIGGGCYKSKKGEFMLNIGFHESKGGKWSSLIDTAVAAGANTFAFFTRNPRALFHSDVALGSEEDLGALQKGLLANNFAPVVAHAPYTANPCSEDAEKRQGAWSLIQSDVEFLAKYLPGAIYNFHPGSPKNLGTEEGIKQVSFMLATILQKTPNAVLTIETMAGKGSEIGRTFEEVAKIIKMTELTFGRELTANLGVCFDTCHTWDAGYDLVNDFDGVLKALDKNALLGRVKAVHLNDSKNALGTRKDRHEITGLGHIGFEALLKVTECEAFRALPFILETPNDEAGYKAEIEKFREKWE